MSFYDLCQGQVTGLGSLSSPSNRILHRHQVSKLEIGLGGNWLYWIVLLIISLTSKLTSVSWGGGRFLTLVDPNYFQPSSAVHSNTESLYRAFDHCISEINWPACLCKESFTGKGIQMKPIEGSAVLNTIILWSGVAAGGDLSTKQALAARCWVFCALLSHLRAVCHLRGRAMLWFSIRWSCR